MTLRDEVSDLAYHQIADDPAGKVFLDGGEDALLSGDFGMVDMLRLLNVILTTHREQILRLADEVDALRQAA